MPTPVIDKTKCTNCNTCVDVCPVECFSNKDSDVQVTQPDTCIGCKACEVQCPVECLVVND